MELRPYQREAIAAAREHLRGARATLVVLPCGAGKTVVFAEIARMAADKGGRVLVLAHRSELLDQAMAKLRAVAPDLVIEREQAGERAHAGDIVVASVQTLHRDARLARWRPDDFRLIVVDEAHHAAAKSYQKILEHFPAAKVLGFTATPDRADGKGLRDTFGSIAFSRSILDLVKLGYLVPIVGRSLTVNGFDIEGVKVVAGDLQDKGLTEALQTPGVLESVARAIVEHHEGRSTLVFVPAVRLAYELADHLNDLAPDAGALAIDGTTRDDERALRFALFERGSRRFLVNVGIATEGTDLPRCSCVAVVRPTMSRSLFVQMVGRGCRLFEGKADALVLNFAPTNTRHKLVAPLDAMLDDDLDAMTRAVVHELAAEDPDADVVDLIEAAVPIVEERRRTVHSIEAQIEEWDPYGLVTASDHLPFMVVAPTADEVERARNRCQKAGVPVKALRKLSDVQVMAFAHSVDKAAADRKRRGLCTIKVARMLARRGLNPNVSARDGTFAVLELKKVGWRYTPDKLKRDERFRVHR